VTKTEYTHKYTHTYRKSGLTMTDSSNYKPTPKAQEILDTLLDVGDWIGRSDLANRLNKNVLNKWDIVLLSKMTEAGLIESQQIPHHGPIGYEWQYRAVLNNQS
jgi:hypothetical protein